MSAYDTATAKPEQDSAYAAAPIPWAWRVVKVLAVAATAVLLEVSLYYKSLEPGESSIAGWMAAILVAAIWAGFKLWKKRETKRLATIDTPIIPKDRPFKMAASTGLLFCVLSPLYAYWFVEGMLADYWWKALLFVVIWAVYLGMLSVPQKSSKYTRAAMDELARINATKYERAGQQGVREAELLGRWWVRYPLGVAVMWGGMWFADQRSDNWLIPLAASLFALVLMREIFFAVLLCGLAYAFLGALASLPVSAAIIMGALIIANGRK